MKRVTRVLAAAALMLLAAQLLLPPASAKDACGASLRLKYLGEKGGLLLLAPEYRGSACGEPPQFLRQQLKSLAIDVGAVLSLEDGSLVVKAVLRIEAAKPAETVLITRYSLDASFSDGKGRLNTYMAAEEGEANLSARLLAAPDGIVVEGSLLLRGPAAPSSLDKDSVSGLLGTVVPLLWPARVEELNVSKTPDGWVNASFRAVLPYSELERETGASSETLARLIKSLYGFVNADLVANVSRAEAAVFADLRFDPAAARDALAAALRYRGYPVEAVEGQFEASYSLRLNPSEARVEAMLRGPVLAVHGVEDALGLSADMIKTIAWLTGYEPLDLGSAFAEQLIPSSVTVETPGGGEEQVPFPGGVESPGTVTTVVVTTHTVIVNATEPGGAPPATVVVTVFPTTAPSTMTVIGAGGAAAPAAQTPVTITVTTTVPGGETVTKTVTTTATVTKADPAAVGAAAAGAAIGTAAAILVLASRRETG